MRALIHFILIGALWFCMPETSAVQAETQSQSGKAQAITYLIWSGRFSSALDSCNNLIKEEPNNPLGYCLLGITYHSIASQYRSDRYPELITRNLDTAIALAQGRIKSQDPEKLFILGSAYGYRALERSVHGNWWGAFRDGHKSCVLLSKAYELDSMMTDAFMGIGDYHYWKSAKSRLFTWIPFIGDRRQQGIDEIRRAIKLNSSGVLCAQISHANLSE